MEVNLVINTKKHSELKVLSLETDTPMNELIALGLRRLAETGADKAEVRKKRFKYIAKDTDEAILRTLLEETGKSASQLVRESIEIIISKKTLDKLIK